MFHFINTFSSSIHSILLKYRINLYNIFKRFIAKVLKKKLSQRRLLKSVRNEHTEINKKYFNMKSQQTSTRVEQNKQCNKKE